MTRELKMVFREATAEELLACRLNHAAAWAGGLTVEQYVGREKHISSQDLTRDGGIRFWVLTDGETPANILCSCETITKDAVVAHAKGGTEFVKANIVGSVFTPERNRGKGFASVMLRKLAEVLQSEGCLFDCLYSDVGKRFYSRMGWKPYESTHISLPPAGRDNETPKGVRLLKDEDLKGEDGLCARDVKAALHDFQKRPLADGVDHRVAFVPTYDVMRWHHAREEYVGHHLTGKTPIVKGAIATESQKRWCIWTRTFNNLDESCKTLYVLRMVDEEEGCREPEKEDGRIDEIAGLLEAAQTQAAIWGLTEVVVWNPSRRVVEAAKRLMGTAVPVVDRDEDSITSLRWTGPDGPDATIQWDLNEKFSWC
ncbi:hypothetical protein DFH27DRAFT_261031 [Peziza echinospora]|nr:hypothetical protein DFH27DRAFT_261031 [Peziza echinospora]